MASENCPDISVNHVEENHLKDVFAMFQEEGWDTQLHELELFYMVYGQHMYGAFNTDDQMLGHVFARPISDSLVVVEMVISKKEARGKGIGKALMNFVTAKFGKYNICILPLVDKEGFYAKFGLSRTDVGVLKIVKPLGEVPASFTDNSMDVKLLTGDSNIEKILSYKKSVHDLDSEMYLKHLCQSPSVITMYAESDNTVKGFIIVRPLESLVRVCSFYADDLATAKCLLYECSKRTVPGIKYKIALSAKNGSNVKQLFEELWGPGFDDLAVETLMTTSGEFKERVSWEKIYGVLEATLMMFV